MTTKIITHNRFFNLDEIAAIALLDIFYLNGNYEIIRTRDEKQLSAYKKDDTAFVIDVGFEYDEKMKNFDHHQKSLKIRWNTGEAYSSCGLIWKFLKDEKHLNSLTNNEIQKFESAFVKPVDLQDNGVKFFNEMSFVSSSNRNHFNDDVIDGHFKRTLKIVKSYIENMIFSLKNRDKDLFANNYSVTKETVFMAAIVLIKNYAFDKKFSFNMDESKAVFTTTDKYDEPLIYTLEKETQTFSINDIVIGTDHLVNDVWRYFKSSNRLTQKMNEETVSLMETYFIDKFKIGYSDKEMSYFLSCEKANVKSNVYFDALNNFFMNVFAFIRNEISSNKMLKKYVKNSKIYDDFILCDSNIRNAAFKLSSMCKDKKYVVLPRDKNSWKIQVLNHVSDTVSMPRSWQGLKGNALHKAANNDKLIFCHKTGFMCMFEGTKKDVIKFINENL